MIPAGPQPRALDQSAARWTSTTKKSRKIYPIECQKEFQKTFGWDKMRVPERMSENMSKKCRLAGVIFVPKAPLHTEVFTQRRKILHTDAFYKDVFAHLNKGT